MLATFKGLRSGKYKRHFFGGKVEPNCVDTGTTPIDDELRNDEEQYLEYEQYELQKQYEHGVANKDWYEYFKTQLSVKFSNTLIVIVINLV